MRYQIVDNDTKNKSPGPADYAISSFVERRRQRRLIISTPVEKRTKRAITPAPNTYSMNYTQTETKKVIAFGHGERTFIASFVSKNDQKMAKELGPGKYNIASKFDQIVGSRTRYRLYLANIAKRTQYDPRESVSQERKLRKIKLQKIKEAENILLAKNNSYIF